MCGLVSSRGTAQTLTVRYEATVPLTRTEWNVDVQLPQFYNPFAQLVSARLGVDTDAVMSLRIENYRNRGAADVETWLGARVTVTGPEDLVVGVDETPVVVTPLHFDAVPTPVTGDALLVQLLAQIHRVDSLDSYDGTWDYDGPSGVTLLGLKANDGREMSYTDPQQLEIFSGEGAIGFHVNASAARSMTGPGNVRVKTTVFAKATVWVEYEYQPYREDCGGGTRGFWGNRNGLALITDFDLNEILNNYLNLRDRKGNLVDFASRREFARWIRRAGAWNMAHQLSAQLAAFTLNVLHQKWGLNEVVPLSEQCFPPDGLTAYELILMANESLAVNGLTPPCSAERDYQECLKNALDAANQMAEERICEGECAPCEGKVTQLTLAYAGDVTDQITVIGGKKRCPVVFFDGFPGPDGAFTVTGEASADGTLGTEIVLLVNGCVKATIHTSCSKPIGPGLVAGPFTVVEGYSLKGGLLCPVENEDGDECGDCCHHHKGCGCDKDCGGKHDCDKDCGCEHDGHGGKDCGCGHDCGGKHDCDKSCGCEHDGHGGKDCDCGHDCGGKHDCDKDCGCEQGGKGGHECSWDGCQDAGDPDWDCVWDVGGRDWWQELCQSGGSGSCDVSGKAGKDRCAPDRNKPAPRDQDCREGGESKKQPKKEKSWWCWW